MYKRQVSKVIVGKRNVSELVLTSIIAGGHVLLEDVPGDVYKRQDCYYTQS